MRIRDIRYQQKIFITELTEKKINMYRLKELLFFIGVYWTTGLPQQCCPNGVASCEQSINLDRWVLSVNQHVSLFYSSQNNGGDRTGVKGDTVCVQI
jgi:hypothetical protein